MITGKEEMEINKCPTTYFAMKDLPTIKERDTLYLKCSIYDLPYGTME